MSEREQFDKSRERERFETWLRTFDVIEFDTDYFGVSPDTGNYTDSDVQRAWAAWQAGISYRSTMPPSSTSATTRVTPCPVCGCGSAGMPCAPSASGSAWLEPGEFDYKVPAQSLTLEAGERGYIYHRPTGKWLVVEPPQRERSDIQREGKP